MKILILGTNYEVEALIDELNTDNNEITVISADTEKLEQIQEQYDLKTICGVPTYPKTLEQANIMLCDLIIAITNSDEQNMLACFMAGQLYKVPTKIAKITSLDYLSTSENLQKGLHIDFIINPVELVTNYLQDLLEYPDVLELVNLSNGLLKMVSIKVEPESSLVNNKFSQLSKRLPNVTAKIVAIFRDDQAINLASDSVILANDEVFILSKPQDLLTIISKFHTIHSKGKNIMIAGGGAIGLSLAKKLEKRCNVKIIEKKLSRLNQLSLELNFATILSGDVVDQELLLEESISEIEEFISLTSRDEDNIVSAMLAKKLGVARTIAIINRTNFVELLSKSYIDVGISPNLLTVDKILQNIKSKDVISRHSLKNKSFEVIESVATGDPYNSKIIGKKIDNIKWPEQIVIGAVVREGQIYFDVNELFIQAKDHFVIFLHDRSCFYEIEQLFSSELKIL